MSLLLCFYFPFALSVEAHSYIVINKATIGSFLRITQICKHCKNEYVWESQPYVGKIPAGKKMNIGFASV